MRYVSYTLGACFMVLALVALGDLAEVAGSDHKQIMIGVAAGIIAAMFTSAGFIASELTTKMMTTSGHSSTSGHDYISGRI